MTRLYAGKGWRFEALRFLVEKLNTGSRLWLLPFLAAGARRSFEPLKYPSLRWAITQFVGDIIGYQRTPEDTANYDRIHALYAQALGLLRERAGGTAPLCVLAHSLGSVISSDFFYDLQQNRHRSLSPLERGETLCHLFTMGSPMGLWAVRYSGAALDQPITVPHAKLVEHWHELAGIGGWTNFFDDDDVLATPLRGLSEAYEKAVKEDVLVRLGGLRFSWHPLVHAFYWSDDRVLKPIAAQLARVWRGLSTGAGRRVFA